MNTSNQINKRDESHSVVLQWLRDTEKLIGGERAFTIKGAGSWGKG